MNTTAIPATNPKAPRGGPVRKSKRAKWRATVLIAVHLLIAAHILHWVITGSTLTPVEPSEAMQTLELGRINAGFVFFVVALLATLVLGRWFCGWACHVVAYQDLSAWILGKLNIRPKPIRSRLLMWTPMLLALYMFVWPQFKIWFSKRERLPWEEHFFTESFWETFAGPWMAVTTLFVCGFLVVYWMGAKGFCSYGCPYGGFFGFLDKYSPGRIRVTDDCEGCRHCTSVCTSNVLVHEEVLRHRMVVDPGCMKCMDCVDVCPKGALYYGFGKPAVALKNLAGKLEPWARTALTFVLVFAIAFPWIYWSDNTDLLPTWFELASAGVVAAMVTLSNRRERNFDFSLGEEVAMAVIFLVSSQLAFRRLYDAIPNLLAIGLGTITAVLAISLYRILRNADFTVQHHVLRKGGRLTGLGIVFLLGSLTWLGLTAHSYFVQHEVRAMNSALAEYDQARQGGAEREERLQIIRRALGHADTAASYGFLPNAWVDYQRGHLGMQVLPPREWVPRTELLEGALEEFEDTPNEYEVRSALINAYAMLNRPEDSLRAMTDRRNRFPNDKRSWLELADALATVGDSQGTMLVLQEMLQQFPNDPDAIRRIQILQQPPK